MTDKHETSPSEEEFDFSIFPADILFHDRRKGQERRGPRRRAGRSEEGRPPVERRTKKERRRRIDPTTFERQYTEDEIEFMNAMQRFKVQTGKEFPTYGEVLRVACSLGYRKMTFDLEPERDGDASHPAEISGIPFDAGMALSPAVACPP
ncbi:MAG: hypothetical protein JOZ63_19080 [Planctomycetaceae bacterium]|nr:hypothetical protein [Planctomycetaceae bacterium]